jgi:hypothetical protein
MTRSLVLGVLALVLTTATQGDVRFNYRPLSLVQMLSAASGIMNVMFI